jgi:DNA-binding response OmpR family regulator
MARLLFVEDDPSISESLGQALTTLGHSVRAVGSAEDALVVVGDSATGFDLAIVDVMLPGVDGFEFCRRVTVDADLPVILLTARSDPIDIVVGLECGADDYVTKSVQPRVLDARIKTVLRRSSPAAAAPRGTELGAGIVLDQLAMTVVREGRGVHLTPTEMRLLIELVNHRGQVLTRRVLLERVWEYGYAGDARLVDAAIQRLRAKIEVEPSRPALIHTVRGLGYRMDAV